MNFGKVIALDVETEPFDKKSGKRFAWQLELIGVGVYDGKNKKFLFRNELDPKFQKFLDERKVVMHNAKFDLAVLREVGFEVADYEDTMILSWLIDENRLSFGLKQLAKSILKVKVSTFDDLGPMPKRTVQGQSSLFEFVSFEEEFKAWIDKLVPYCIRDCEMTLKLWEKFKLPPELEAVYKRIELPMVKIIGSMERAGVQVDETYLNDLKERLAKDAMMLRTKLLDTTKTHGYEDFNFDSPKQLRELLYDKMGIELPTRYKTEKGELSTDVEALEFVQKVTKDEFISKLLRYRAIKKLETSYVDAIRDSLYDGKIFTSFNQTGTVTGRFSCKSPNMQSIPRGELGYDIKRIFEARPGYNFVIADYSQMELRVLAYFSNDQFLLQAYANDLDVHAATAEMLGCTRMFAKCVNFGIVYGQSPWGLAQQLGISEKEAKTLIENYLSRFPGVKNFLQRATQQVRNFGYVETITRRRRRFPEYRTYKEIGNFSEVRRMERQAGNSIIQGSVADIIKIAMRNIGKNIPEAKILLQIHDELLIEIPESMTPDLIKKEMELAINLSTVKLKVEPKVCKYWQK